MYFYETDWPYGSSFYNCMWIDDLYWPVHFHNNFEINYVAEGELELILDGETHLLHAGDIAFVFPKQVHGYKKNKPSKTCIVSFSADMIGSFAQSVEGQLPENNIISGMFEFADKFTTENYFKQKGLLYEICGTLKEHTEFKKEIQNKDQEFLHRVFTYIEENYMNDCSMQTVSKALNYSYSYLSKKFTHYMGVSYTEYLNRYRIDRAMQLLNSENDLTVSRISDMCGFDSLCSFNRNFKKFTGITPKEAVAKKNA